jgi:hypothetical protein
MGFTAVSTSNAREPGTPRVPVGELNITVWPLVPVVAVRESKIEPLFNGLTTEAVDLKLLVNIKDSANSHRESAGKHMYP